MENYIGAKVIKGEEMDLNTFRRLYKGEAENPPNENQEGYHVRYPDGYDSWSPKEVFENAYRELTDFETKLINNG